jgi:hypothetical protein
LLCGRETANNTNSAGSYARKVFGKVFNATLR